MWHGASTFPVDWRVLMTRHWPREYQVDVSSKAGFAAIEIGELEHDPEKWEPVFRKDHAQTKRKS
jgi:hypothetical protein